MNSAVLCVAQLLTCHISCTESVSMRGGGGRPCWPGPASTAACSASRRARSPRTGTPSGPARPAQTPRWRSGWSPRSLSSSSFCHFWGGRFKTHVSRIIECQPSRIVESLGCSPHWPCGLTRGGALFYHLRVFLSSLLAFCKTQLSVSEGVSQIWIEIQVNNTLPLLLSWAEYKMVLWSRAQLLRWQAVCRSVCHVASTYVNKVARGYLGQVFQKIFSVYF